MRMKTFLDLDSYNVEMKNSNTLLSKNEEHVGLMQIVDKCIQRRKEKFQIDSYKAYSTPEPSPIVSVCGNGDHIEQNNVNNNDDEGNDEDKDVDVETPFINSIPEISSDENVQFISKQQWIEKKSPPKNDNTKLHHFDEEKTSNNFQKASYIQPQPIYQYNQQQQQHLQQQQQQQPMPSEEYRRRQLIMYYYQHKLQQQQSELQYHPFHQLPPSQQLFVHNYQTHQQLFQQQRFYIQQQQQYIQRQLYSQQQQQQYSPQMTQEQASSINLNEYGVQLFNDYYNSQHSTSPIDLQQQQQQQQQQQLQQQQQQKSYQQQQNVKKCQQKVTRKQPLKQYIKKPQQQQLPQPPTPQSQQKQQSQQQTFNQSQEPKRVNVIQPSPINSPKHQTSYTPNNPNTRFSPSPPKNLVNSRLPESPPCENDNVPTYAELKPIARNNKQNNILSEQRNEYQKQEYLNNPYLQQLGHIYARTSPPRSLPGNVQPFSGLPTPPASPMTSSVNTVHYKPVKYHNGSSVSADNRYAPY